MRDFLNGLAFFMFGLAGAMAYAFVYDVEPLSPEKVYSIERDVFMRTNDDWNRDFPTFQEWMNCQTRQEERFHEWLASLSQTIGIEAAIALDPWYQDTREGHAGVAPDNWAKGERD